MKATFPREQGSKGKTGLHIFGYQKLKSHHLRPLPCIKVQHYHHHSADFTGSSNTAPIVCLQRELQLQFSSTQTTVFHFSTIIYMGEACGPTGVREFVCLRCSQTAPAKKRLVSH